MKRVTTYLSIFLTWAILSLTGYFFIKDRLDITWDWLVFGFGIVLILNSYVRKNGQIVMGIIMTVTFGAIILLNANIFEFPRWQLWSVFFISCGLGLILLWTRKLLGSWIILPGGILLFAGGAGFGTENWWHYQRTLRNIVDMWPVMLVSHVIIIIISRNISREQKHIIEN